MTWNKMIGGTDPNSHTHANKTTLDLFSSSAGNVYFNGTLLSGSGGGSTVNPTIKDFYQSVKSGKKIVFVGDSTTEVAPSLYSRLDLYNVVGGWLENATFVNRGNNGGTLNQFVTNTGTKNGINTVILDQADLYVISYGINDIRSGGNINQIRDDLKIAIDRILNETSAYILLRIPNTFLTTSTNGWVTPNTSAQEYSTQLWEVYESFRGYSYSLDIIDIPNLVFGRKAVANHPLMLDQLHPNDFGYICIADEIVQHISGKQKDDFHSFNDYEVILKGWVQTPATDITNSTFKFFTNSTKPMQVDDIIYLGNSYSFVITQTPTVSGGTWTIPHSHVGSFNRLGTVKVMRKK